MFATFEGIEGSGKTTVINLVAQLLQKRGINCIQTREPGGSRLGRELRKILLGANNLSISPLAELHLFLADRAQHLQEVVLPALDQNYVVLCDRYLDSTIAYQGAGRDLDAQYVRGLCEDGQYLLPDITFLLDLPVAESLGRTSARNKRENASETRFDDESRQFHERVRASFLELASLLPERIMILDAKRPAADTALDCARAIISRLPEI